MIPDRLLFFCKPADDLIHLVAYFRLTPILEHIIECGAFFQFDQRIFPVGDVFHEQQD